MLTKQKLEQIEITCFDEKKDLYTNKVSNIIVVDFVENMEIAEMTSENVRNIFFYSRSGI